MFSLSSLKNRQRQSEAMDDSALDSRRFIGALVGLRRINTFTGSSRILWPALYARLLSSGCKKHRVLDVASGGGDVTIALWKQARRAGIHLNIDGYDINAHAVEFANAAAKKEAADVRFFQHDVLKDSFPDDYDFVISSLFLHHLNEHNAQTFLRTAARSVHQGIFIHDLSRSKAGYLFAYYGVRVITRSDVAHEDGPRSVEGAFTPEEVQELAEAAGLHGCRVTPKWPFRFLLEWHRS